MPCLGDLVGTISSKLNVCGFDPQSGHTRLLFGSPVVVHMGVNQLMFPLALILSLFHPPPPKINGEKMFLGGVKNFFVKFYADLEFE